MKFILVPIDFSEATPPVVDEAAKLAGIFGAHLILLHVVQVPRSPSAAAEFGGRAELAKALEVAAERQLLELKVGLVKRGVAAHSLRLTGTPATDIVDQAKKLDAMCIVMGSHGHTALFELVMGSAVSAVLKRAVCPVVIVPQKRTLVRTKLHVAQRRIAAAVKNVTPAVVEHHLMKTILAPVDFSRVTAHVVAHATELARRSGARMVLLNVTRPASMLADHAKLEELAERAFARPTIKPEHDDRVIGDSLELIGRPATVIIDQADRLVAEYIVMGSRGPTSSKNAIGSTAGHVIRGAGCPVILVPASKREAGMHRKTRLAGRRVENR